MGRGEREERGERDGMRREGWDEERRMGRGEREGRGEKDR